MKIRGLALLLAALLLAAVSSTQTVPQVIPAGTVLRVKLTTELSSKSSPLVGRMEARLLKPVKLRGDLVLPKGSYLSGRLVFVRPAYYDDEVVAVLRLALVTLTLPDGRVFRGKAAVKSLSMSPDVGREGMVTQRLGAPDPWAELRQRLAGIELKRGRKFWLRVEQDMVLLNLPARSSC